METLYQPLCFFSVLYFGIISGVLYEIVFLICNAVKSSKFIKFILNFIWAILSGLIFFFAINSYNFGQFRLYLSISFIIGIFVERKIIGYYVAQIFLFLYNSFVKVWCKLKQSAFAKKLFSKGNLKKNDATKT